MPKVLIVEDEPDFAEAIRTALTQKTEDVEVVLADSRAKALEALAREPFDLAICDLKIPPDAENPIPAEEEGEAVFNAMRKTAPGLPIVFLSAYVTVTFMKRVFHKHGEKVDLCGDGKPLQLVHCYEKEDLGAAIGTARDLLDRFRSLRRSIEVSGTSGPLAATPREKRVLRIFARRVEGTVVRARMLSGGLSSSRTFQVSVRDSFGGERALAVAKIDRLAALVREIEGYDKYVAPLSGVSTFAPRIHIIRAGAFDTGAVFYTIAADHDRSLFEVAADSDEVAAKVVLKLRTAQRSWYRASSVSNMTVKDIRKQFASNTTLNQNEDLLKDLPRENVEVVSLQARQGPQHRDLHGMNVLVDRADEPLLIDYGDVGRATSCCDALGLEFGLLFHPEAASLRGAWPTLHQAERWWDLNAFLDGCRTPELVRASRTWAYEVAEGEQEVLATAYALALSALRFDTADKALAAALATSIGKHILDEHG